MIVFEKVLYEVSAILLMATFAGALGIKLRQPLIVSFLLIGIIVGPSGLKIISGHDEIGLLAEFGISILLFVVGLRLDLQAVRSVGFIAVVTGVSQVIITTSLGFFIGILLSIPLVHAAYIALALAFSSTIIIVKLLSDKQEIDELHGQIAIGFLIVQDIIVVLVMVGLSGLAEYAATGVTVITEIGRILLRGSIFFTVVLLLTTFAFPRFLRYIARSQELLLLFAITWAFSLASLGDFLGFSKEVGAFLGGVSLASTQFRDMLSERLVLLRDFLLFFFFIDLGARLNISLLDNQIALAVAFSLLVLIGNPIIVMSIMGIMGYRKQTSFLAGLSVAQISEFSLLLAAFGMALGHINEQTAGLISLIGLITMGSSTYMILYSDKLYRFFSPALTIFEKKRYRNGQ